jgi:hypothetical protein
LFLKLKNKKRVLKSFWKKGVGFGAGEKDLFTKRAFPPPQFPMPLLPDKLLFGKKIWGLDLIFATLRLYSYDEEVNCRSFTRGAT